MSEGVRFSGHDVETKKITDIKNRNDIRVPQPGDQFCFMEQAVALTLDENNLVEQLDRHIALELQVVSPVNRAHTAVTQDCVQTVAIVDDFTDHDLLLVLRYPNKILNWLKKCFVSLYNLGQHIYLADALNVLQFGNFFSVGKHLAWDTKYVPLLYNKELLHNLGAAPDLNWK